VATVLTAFGLYSAWVVLFQNTGYAYPYLSAFYSPTISIGNIPPAVWVFWAPLAFRFSCYYYRKAYFRSFFSDPRWCNFNERKRGPYKGETAFPWVLNNLHRYAFYITAAQVIILWWDAVQAFAFRGHIGIGLGSVIMLVNVVLLSGYTFGCHSFPAVEGFHRLEYPACTVGLGKPCFGMAARCLYPTSSLRRSPGSPVDFVSLAPSLVPSTHCAD
jgi:hypothetical protein